MALKIVPLDRSHVRRAVALHRATRPWAYRGKTNAGVLFWFYDACANRDYTAAAVALDEHKIVGAACAATNVEAGAPWLGRRRRWRSLLTRLLAGRDLARGGWPKEVLKGAAGELRAAFVLSFAALPGVNAADRKVLMDTLAAVASSRGAVTLIVPAAAEDENWAALGFGPPISNDGVRFYSRAL